jgi:hypothetical protein
VFKAENILFSISNSASDGENRTLVQNMCTDACTVGANADQCVGVYMWYTASTQKYTCNGLQTVGVEYDATGAGAAAVATYPSKPSTDTVAWSFIKQVQGVDTDGAGGASLYDSMVADASTLGISNGTQLDASTNSDNNASAGMCGDQCQYIVIAGVCILLLILLIFCCLYCGGGDKETPIHPVNLGTQTSMMFEPMERPTPGPAAPKYGSSPWWGDQNDNTPMHPTYTTGVGTRSPKPAPPSYRRNNSRNSVGPMPQPMLSPQAQSPNNTPLPPLRQMQNTQNNWTSPRQQDLRSRTPPAAHPFNSGRRSLIQDATPMISARPSIRSGGGRSPSPGRGRSPSPGRANFINDSLMPMRQHAAAGVGQGPSWDDEQHPRASGYYDNPADDEYLSPVNRSSPLVLPKSSPRRHPGDTSVPVAPHLLFGLGGGADFERDV